MGALLSAVTTALCIILACQLAYQFWKRRRPHQFVWALSLALFAVGAACQWIAETHGWDITTYHLWYLTGAILTAAYLGQGTIFLQARRRVANATMTILVVASAFALVMVFQAPVDLNAALAGPAVSGKGMPQAIRLLTPFFNTFGTVALVGGALRSTAYFLWNGHGNRRALGTGLIAAGTIVVALGGTLSRFQIPQALYICELIGIVIIFAGFSFTNHPVSNFNLTEAALRKRRQRIATFGVGGGVAAIFGAIMLLPVLPWTMDIVKDVIHVYTEEVPDENKGVYLTTSNGVMQLYSWRVELESFPDDAPVLPAESIQDVVVVYKQFDPPEQYQLYEVSSHQHINWKASHQDGMHLILTPESLKRGDYMLIVPTDSMFGGHTTHYFHLN